MAVFSEWIVTTDGVDIHYAYDREERVAPVTLRDRFNAGYYWYRAEVEKEFEYAYEYDELASEEMNQPPGTLSQEIIYHSHHEFVARVHQFLLPGEERDEAGLPLLGASGMPDPKELLEDAMLFYTGRRRRPYWG